MSRYQKLLVVLDLSKGSEQVAIAGRDLAAWSTAGIVALHVVEFVPIEPMGESLMPTVQIEEELVALQRQQAYALSDATREELLALGRNVRQLWDHPKSLPEFKKRILRTVLTEIIASSAGDTVRFVLHWQGGDHTELTLQKTLTGQHRYVTDTDMIELIRSLARIQPDSMIASILNRMGRRTAHGQRKAKAV